MFRIYRLDTDTAYLTPVYRSARRLTGYATGFNDIVVYVADDPTWTVDSTRLGDYFYDHVRDLTAMRAEIAARLVRGPWRLVVYFDPLLSLTEQATEQDGGLVADRLREAYLTVDERVAALVTAAGPRTAIVLLGREASRLRLPHGRDEETASSATGFVSALGAGVAEGAHREQSLHVRRVLPMLLRLLGVSEGSASEAVPAIGAGLVTGRGTATSRGSSHSDERSVPLTVDALRELGLLSDSTQVPAPSEDGDSEHFSSSLPDRP